jgi:hypothetical protein
MGMPSINITFTELAASAIKRGERGIIAMILKESTVPATNPIVVTSAAEIPVALSDFNKKQLELALMGYVNTPLRVVAYVIDSDDETLDYAGALNYFKTIKFDYLVCPTATTDSVASTIASYVKTERANNKLIKAVLANQASDDEGIINYTTSAVYVGDTVYTAEQYCSRIAGIIAGTILALVYFALVYMGMASSGVYPIQENGAWTLRCIVYQLFAGPGAILLAAIFTLACLTTCVGLITSISQYFSTLFKKFTYRQFVFGISIFAFVICNQGLTAILSISVPILNAIYPVSIVLIILGLSHEKIKDNRFIYPLTILGTAVISVLAAIDGLGVNMGIISRFCHSLPMNDLGFGWTSVTVIMLVISLVMNKIKKDA